MLECERFVFQIPVMGLRKQKDRRRHINESVYSASSDSEALRLVIIIIIIKRIDNNVMDQH